VTHESFRDSIEQEQDPARLCALIKSKIGC
jgi:hypothetical protein